MSARPLPEHPVVLATAPLRGPGLAELEAWATVICDPWIDETTMRLLQPDELAARIRDEHVDVVICEADPCKGAVLDAEPAVIGSTRGDPTNVDVPGATAKGIPVLHAPGRNADGVAELCVALCFAVNRHVLPADRDVRAGQVFADGTIPYQRFRAPQLAGRTIGIIGLGAVGRAAKWRFEGLGLRVVTADPFAADATHDLDGLLAEADVVSMHAAVTPDTFGMMDASRFAAMKPGAIYLNTARAGLHDVDALVDALASGHLAGAGLDHFDGEQLPAGHRLLAMDNVVLTPHIGGATLDTEANHTTLMADGLAALRRGDAPPNLVNPEVLDHGR